MLNRGNGREHVFFKDADYNPGGGFGYGAAPVTTDSLGNGSFNFAYQINGTTS